MLPPLEEVNIPPGQDLRGKVLEEAQSWLGTPFHHGQRCKGAGVDCGQFLLGVYHNAGCIPDVRTEYYPRDFHLHRDREWYRDIVETYADEMKRAAGRYLSPLPGDVVLYRIGRIFSHGAIVVDWPRIIHSHVSSGVAYANGQQGPLTGYMFTFFRPRAFTAVGGDGRG